MLLNIMYDIGYGSVYEIKRVAKLHESGDLIQAIIEECKIDDE